MTTFPKKIKAKKFDALFDEGKDVSAYLNLTNIKKEYPVHRVTICFPEEVWHQISEEAARKSIRKTALLKTWIAERLKSLRKSHSLISKSKCA